MTVMAIGDWATNGKMIADVARLGYLRQLDMVCDPTYGMGRWWTDWQPIPGNLCGSDLDPKKSPLGPMDATDLPWVDEYFDVVAIDGPYKLNGTPTTEVDEQYGVHIPTHWQDRHALLADMMTEGWRVLKTGGIMLFKCQDQVCSGKVRWQTDIFTRHGEELGMEKIDALLFPSYRAQPAGRAQKHARRNYSTLLIFRA